MDENFLEAAELAQAVRIAAGITQASNAKKIRPFDFVGYCYCGEAVPQQRIELGYFVCVPCQSAAEKQQRRNTQGK